VAAPDIELVMALIKRGPLETVIEKSVELGVGRIRLVTTRRTNSDHTNVSRLTAIAIEAAEQCERLDLPPIEAPVKLEKLLDQWPAERRLLFCDEADAGLEAGGEGAAKALPQQQLLQSLPPGPAAILIGPEGGFDPAERERLRLHPAVIPVTLGPRILRAETAAMAALTLWQAAHGDWRAS
jgi:16S rRNA (uracil1498-N3)-methyltransferase